MKASVVLRGLSTWARLLLLFFAFSCSASTVTPVAQEAAKSDTVAVNIGVIYDENNWIGKMGMNCIKMALSDFYNSHGHYKTRVVLQTRLYPKDSIVGAAAAALYLLKYTEVKAIMGPTTSTEAEFVIHLGREAQVPIISYSATSPFLSSTQSSYFIRAAQDDSFQAKSISALVKIFGWREVVPVYVDSDYGAGFIPFLVDALQQIDACIPHRGVMPSSVTDDQIHEQLYRLKTMQARVFVLHMPPELASRVFLKVSELGMMNEGYVWITTTSISNGLGSLDHSVIESMQGVIGVKTYVPETDELTEFNNRWDQEFRDLKLNVAASNSGFKKKKVLGNLTDLDTLGVSPIGPKLLQAVLNTSFSGLSGSFSLTDGQLESSTYKIINVIGSSSRDIGFWTPEKGLMRHFNSSASNASLRTIIWPGETTLIPKGWVVPASRRKLRVGVPVKAVYKELVNVTRHESNGTPISHGFCIDVFETVMQNLQYSGLYDYLPFAKPDGSPAGSYDDLVYQVFLQKYDIVVGDITIIANRSYVDFTLPFTESGVTMVVPVRNEKRSPWVFLKPLSWDLWVISLCAFTFIAFAIWILEHRTNEEFQGPALHQAGTSLFYSFSMMVFAQRENMQSNLARFLVIVWIFVVFILTQSYTASLTSMLTVQQLQPIVTDVHELINRGSYVGFQEGSFVKGLLTRKGFHESKLVSYNTSENLHDLLSRGSTNGGIAAVFDEIPYMRLFLAKYSSKYVMVQLIYRTDGFGFVFPKGSRLAPEVSREILNVIEGDEMLKMEKTWGMLLYNGSDQGNKVVASSNLGLDSFWGLFLLAGVASGVSLFIFTVTFLYEHRHIWWYSNASIWSRTQDLAKAFQQRDMASRTFRKNKMQNTRNARVDQPNISYDNTSSPPMPSSYSDQTEDDLAFSARATHSPQCSSSPFPPAQTSAVTEVVSHIASDH